jgi:SAM-dependent methyltransferase
MHESEYGKIFELEKDHWWFEGRRRLLRLLLERHLPDRTARILDVGCGTGHHLIFLKDLGYTEPAGTDFSPIAIEFCRKLGLGDVHQGDAAGLGYADESFGGALAFDVLEHIDDDAAALREIRRVLRPGGRAIVTVPAFQALWSRHDEVLQHRRRYRFRDWPPLAEKAGLEIEDWSYFFFTVFPLVAAVRFASRVFKVKKTSDLEVVPRPINAVLKRVGAMEAAALKKLPRLPIGTTLAVVLRRV